MRDLIPPFSGPHRDLGSYEVISSGTDSENRSQTMGSHSSETLSSGATDSGSIPRSSNQSAFWHSFLPYSPSTPQGSIATDRYPKVAQSKLKVNAEDDSSVLKFSPFENSTGLELMLDPNEKEADDYLHNPDPIADDKEDLRCHKLDKRGWGCVIASLLLLAGFIVVFIFLPILDFTGPAQRQKTPNQVTASARLSPYSYKKLSAVRPLIDEDTPESAKTHTSHDGSTWDLVFSDEFNVDGRTFYPGDDQFWEAQNFYYQATQDLEWYDPDAITTANGTLRIRLDAFNNHNLNYRSGMIQSWNKLCFSQGYIEVGAKLPGNGSVPGLWPGIWTIGNLARPGYTATSEGVWPYSYNDCDAGITPNQSMYDGTSYLPGQRLNKCTCKNEDHPTPGKGRGAPEIDLIEGAVSSPPEVVTGVASQSLQTAPMDIWWMPDYDFIEIHNYSVTKMNAWNGGPFQQAVSGTTMLNNNWYQYSENPSFQRYGLEYLANDTDGYISWHVGSEETYSMYQGALSPNGNVGQRDISREPMSIVMNLGLSNSWAYIDWVEQLWPNILEIDYVRVYQPPGNHSITCDPEGYETTGYIAKHPKAYRNPNATSWTGAGYEWPKNSLMNDCK